MQYEYAAAQGKHVFMEKPVAVDAPGIRRILAANEIAKQKNLKVGVGLQRHHFSIYEETIKRLKDGAVVRTSSCAATVTALSPGIPPRAKE